MKTPKHLAHLPPDEVAKLQTGFNALRFGFAETGTIYRPDPEKPGLEFLGNFKRMKDAHKTAAETGGKVSGYLSGKLAVGWVVCRVTA